MLIFHIINILRGGQPPPLQEELMWGLVGPGPHLDPPLGIIILKLSFNIVIFHPFFMGGTLCTPHESALQLFNILVLGISE